MEILEDIFPYFISLVVSIIGSLVAAAIIRAASLRQGKSKNLVSNLEVIEKLESDIDKASHDFNKLIYIKSMDAACYKAYKQSEYNLRAQKLSCLLLVVETFVILILMTSYLTFASPISVAFTVFLAVLLAIAVSSTLFFIINITYKEENSKKIYRKELSKYKESYGLQSDFGDAVDLIDTMMTKRRQKKQAANLNPAGQEKANIDDENHTDA